MLVDSPGTLTKHCLKQTMVLECIRSMPSTILGYSMTTGTHIRINTMVPAILLTAMITEHTPMAKGTFIKTVDRTTTIPLMKCILVIVVKSIPNITTKIDALRPHITVSSKLKC
jgi:hypothetical protein